MILSQLENFHFLRPVCLLAIIPIIALWAYLWHCRKQYSNWQQVCDAHLLPYLLLNRAQSHQALPFTLVGIAWLLAVLALAGPTWSISSFTVYRNMLPQVLAVDLSENMYATDIRPNRFKRMRYKLIDIINQTTEGQVGMLAFSNESYLISPLTEDAKTLATMIPELNPEIMPVRGSNIAQAIDYAAKLLEQSDEKKGHIIVVTGSNPGPSDFEMAQKVHSLGYSISVYAVGTGQGAPIVTDDGFVKDVSGNIELAKLDATKLRHLARAGGGIYIPFTNDDNDVKRIKELIKVRQASTRHSKQTIEVWQDQGRWLIFLLLPIAALAFRRGWHDGIVS